VGGDDMWLYEIEKNATLAFDYLERQVNNGSKSGFTSIHNTSMRTNPLYSDGFNILKLFPMRTKVECFGTFDCGDGLISDDNSIFIHPDWQLPQNIKELSELGAVEKSMWVIPTSSSRTVRFDGSDIYVKLHYPGIIGRLNRVLGFQQLVSGIEITAIFEEARINNNLPAYFDFMPESYGRLLRVGQKEIGFIIREIPKRIKDCYLIPGFSLFSNDRNEPDNPQILAQILEHKKYPKEFFFKEICCKLIDVFFWCVLEEGLIPEMHAQNVVFAFNKKWELEKVVLRDFESIDKDITIRHALGKNTTFEEYPYKCISSDNKDYLKRHSFMYDHKLCEYLLDPLVDSAVVALHINAAEIHTQLRNYVRKKYGDIISTFFPINGCWYKYPNIEINRTTNDRPFMSMGPAVYR